MATLDNQRIEKVWTKVSEKECSIQVLLGSCYVSIGVEPTSKKGHLLTIGNNSSLVNAKTDETWVIASEGSTHAIIAVTEA